MSHDNDFVLRGNKLPQSLCLDSRLHTRILCHLFALSAMAGCVGGGGLGDYAIRYGFQRYQTDATIVTVIILLVLITIVQSIGNLLTRKMQ